MSPAPVLRGIDHLIVAVRDLDRSAELWRKLGFSVTPRGFHQTGGTANHLILLDQTYIELLGVVDSSERSPFARYLDLAPGLSGVAFRASADEAYEYWQAQGLFAATPASLARGVDVQGRPEVARFRLTMLEDAPELPLLLFCCEQLTPEFVWQPGRAPHANGAHRLKELVFVADEPATGARLRRITGRAPEGTAGDSSLELGEVTVSLFDRARFHARFGEDADFRGSGAPSLAGFALESDDLARARDLAQSAGCTVREDPGGGSIALVPEEGVVIEWRRSTQDAPSRQSLS